MKRQQSCSSPLRCLLAGLVVGGSLYAGTRAASGQADASRVELPHTGAPVALKGAVTGYDSTKYLVHLDRGVIVNVALTATSKSTYFNIFSPGVMPGRGDAVYVSSLLGNQTRFRANESGDYLLQIYLFRNAARRGVQSHYLLRVGAMP